MLDHLKRKHYSVLYRQENQLVDEEENSLPGNIYNYKKIVKILYKMILL